jgi:hypothetical protein
LSTSSQQIVEGHLILDTSGYTHSLPEAVEPEEAASKLWKDLMSKDIKDTGTFWHREGQELPW